MGRHASSSRCVVVAAGRALPIGTRIIGWRVTAVLRQRRHRLPLRCLRIAYSALAEAGPEHHRSSSNTDNQYHGYKP